MQEAANQIIASKGTNGVTTKDVVVCFWVTEKFKTELFFCFNKASHTIPYLFHYSWSREDRSKGVAERLHWVDSITDYIKMKFKNGGSGNISTYLKSALYWTGKWTPEFKPSDHCQITLSGQKYTLTCKPTLNNSSNAVGFTKTISESEVVELNSNLKNSEQFSLK